MSKIEMIRAKARGEAVPDAPAAAAAPAAEAKPAAPAPKAGKKVKRAEARADARLAR